MVKIKNVTWTENVIDIEFDNEFYFAGTTEALLKVLGLPSAVDFPDPPNVFGQAAKVGAVGKAVPLRKAKRS